MQLRTTLFALVTLSALVPAQQLLIDLNTAPKPSPPSYARSLFAAGSQVYFVANRSQPPATGIELYQTDGRPGSIRLVADLHPGVGNANPSGFLKTQNYVYFGAEMGSSDRGFYRLDSASGLELLYTVGPTLVSDSKAFAESNGWVYIDGASLSRRYLYRLGNLVGQWSPGTKLSPLDPSRGSADAGGELVFTPGDEPWITGGTPATTRRLLDVHPTGRSEPDGFITVGGRIYFAATDPVAGRELWQTDGTSAGTQRVADIAPGSQGSDPTDFFSFNGQLLFSAENGSNGRELWVTTSTGVVMLRDIATGAASSTPSGFATFKGYTYFAATDGAGDRELWRTDGTTAGTARFANLASIHSSQPRLLTPAGGKLYFTVQYYQSSRNSLLMVSDGTLAGTGPASALQLSVREMVPGGAGADVVMIASNGGSAECWSSRGTHATTAIVGNPNQSSNDDSSPSAVFAVGGRGVFAATTPQTGRELYETDGTATGTRLVTDLNPGAGDSSPSQFAAIGRRTVFSADSGNGQQPHWYEPGQPVQSLNLNPLGAQSPTAFTEFKGFCYFLATVSRGSALFRTDFTTAGTTRVSSANQFTRIRRAGNNLFLFSSSTGPLWVSDGTFNGTKALGVNLVPSGTGSLGNQLLFFRQTMGSFAIPSITDGTLAGTHSLLTGRSHRHSGFATHRGVIFFCFGGRAYRSDGTAAGTTQLQLTPVSMWPAQVRATVDSLILTGERYLSTRTVMRCNFDGGNARILCHIGTGWTHYHVHIEDLKLHGGGEQITFRSHEVPISSPDVWKYWYVTGGGKQQVLSPAPVFAPMLTTGATVIGDKILVNLTHRQYGEELFSQINPGIAVTLSSGCAANGAPPRIRTRRWARNQIPKVVLDDAVPGTASVLILGAPAASPVDLGGGCQLHVDLGLPVVLQVKPTDAEGSAAWVLSRIPTTPHVVGLALSMQAASGPSAQAPLGLDLSNGLRVVVGR